MSISKVIIATGVMMLSGLAANATGVQLTNTVFKQVESKTAAGKVEIKLAPVGMVTPGDRVRFIMGYRNSGSKPASNIIITNPVPMEVAYTGPQEGGEPQVSVDGGKTFSTLSALSVKNADGTARPARTSDVTHVRWQIARVIAPGEAGQVSFNGQLK
jgi:uncharacterized repeat protein (TIGR01451 family)